MNFTSNSSSEILPEFRTYRYVKLASAIVLCILSPITAISNALLLTAIYRDPLRCFRTPMTYFIAGLSVADLLTGIFVEPMLVSYYFADFADFRNHSSLDYELVHKIGGIISTITITESFFIVLALSVCQYIAVRYPHQFKVIVSRNRVLTFLAASSVYITFVCLLQFTGIDEMTYLKVHLILHPTLISAILIVVQVMLFSSFNRYLQRGNSLRNSSARTKSSFKRRPSERQFTVMTFYLAAILLASSSMHTVFLYIYLFDNLKTEVKYTNVLIGLRISDLMLFIKVALDIFIYAWRLPSYRKALRCTLFGRKTEARFSVYLKSNGGVSPGQLNGRGGPGTETTTV
ncbi:adrenocorticotropic hormone receptor-like [Montipora capricornis]|uniref:adrenocorticotropic hormone receptor-like n=1 Tax=Montipora capricornis TaxID=246305 RepID=UPI0035F1990C